MELNAHINEDSQDLLGFHAESPGDELRPVFKMQKQENAVEKKKTPVTLVLTKDKNSGTNYILINNKRVPIKNIPLPEDAIKSMCVSENRKMIKKNQSPCTNSKKIYIESKMVKLDNGIFEKIINNEKVSKLVSKSDNKLESISEIEINLDKKIKYSHARCNLALSKHKNSLLDIIQNLRKDNHYLKTGIYVAKRKMHLLQSKYSSVEISVCEYLDEIKSLKETIANLKLKQFHGDKPITYEIGLQTDLQHKDDITTDNCVEDNYATIKQDYLPTVVEVDTKVGEELVVCQDRSVMCNSPYENLIGIILHQDINMGVKLNVPNVIAYNNGKSTQYVNGQMDARMLFWMCYKMCDKQDEEGDYPIHLAVSHNDHVAVRRQCQALKLRNMPVDLENADGYTPLQLAIINKVSSAIVAELKSFNSNFYSTDNYGNNIFHLAAINQYLKELDKIGLLEKTDHINTFNYEGYTPLMLAVIHKNIEDAEVLIKLEANLNLQDKKTGKTALFHAVESNSLDLVNLLMVNGADTAKRNFAGHTVQDTIAEVEVTAMLRKLFNELEENLPETRGRKRGREKVLKTISKKVKI